MSYPPQVHQHQQYPRADGPQQLIRQPGGRRTGMVVGATAAVLALVLGGTALGAYLIDRNPDGASQANGAASATSPTNLNPDGASRADGGTADDLRATAQEYVDAVNNGDEAAARELTCGQIDAGALFTTARGSGVTRAIGESRVVRADYATVEITVPDSAAQPVPLPFRVRNGAWCVAV